MRAKEGERVTRRQVAAALRMLARELEQPFRPDPGEASGLAAGCYFKVKGLAGDNEFELFLFETRP